VSVRVRFAPSPTGHLHIGGARTALFNWLFARGHGGKFILRIEDTDRQRSTKESIVDIIRALEWLGLKWDEGPYPQMERLDIYRGYAQRLLKEGKAYQCFCTPEELVERRKLATSRSEAPGYDRRCRNSTKAERREYISQGRKPAVRFSLPEGSILFADLVKGEIRFENSLLDDFVILKSDDIPTYNFSVVIDDALMGITHVIRGEDHLSNTPRQILLYRVLGFKVPQFAHLPMILGQDGAPLSKRHGAVTITQYRQLGYLPQALVNYSALLGWGTPDSQQVFSREELIDRFSLSRVGKTSAIFDIKKLNWINSYYIKESDPKEVLNLVIDCLKQRGLVPENVSPQKREWVAKVVKVVGDRMKYILQIVDYAGFLFQEDVIIDQNASKKFLTKGVAAFLCSVRDNLAKLEPFKADPIEESIRGDVEKFGIRPKEAMQAIRVALTGQTISPGLFDVIELLGRKKTLRRLDAALKRL